MTRDQFADALDHRGADLLRWPAAERQERARPRRRGSDCGADARRCAAPSRRTRRTDAAGTGDVGGVGGALRRIRGGDDDATAMGPPTWRLTAWVAAAAVLCLAIGFTVGMTASPSDSDEAIATLMFGTTPIPAGGLL